MSDSGSFRRKETTTYRDRSGGRRLLRTFTQNVVGALE
jgi:hypothetical protein